MINFHTKLVLLFCISLSFLANAQQGRYLQEVFDDVTVTENVTYGANTTLLYAQQLGPVKEALVMDVYEPTGDSESARPMVLILHTGNFLPRIINGSIQGTRRDSSAVEIATRLAKMGYVVASADYRLGWRPDAATQPLRALGLIQAAYRGVQDGRTCIRYFKNDANNANNFKIDPNRIAVWGNGTGGYIALAMATIDEFAEVFDTEMPAGKFFFDHDGNPATPEIPMINAAYHGDPEGKVETIAPVDGFGYEMGDTSSFSNWPNESSDFQLAVNVGGALGDIAWLDANSAPIISYHHYQDQFAPYESAVLLVPGANLNIVEVQGSKLIAERSNEFGNNDVFIDANIDDTWTDAATANSGIAGHEFMEALYPVVTGVNPLGQIEGVVIDWWDPNAIDPNPVTNMDGKPWNELVNPLSPVPGLTFHETGLSTNFGMSEEKARTNIDTLIGFFAPRAFAALNLINVSTEEISGHDVALEVAPIPAGAMLRFSSAADAPIRNISIYDLSGRLLENHKNIDNSTYSMTRGNLGSGMYIAHITFDTGLVAQKLMFE